MCGGSQATNSVLFSSVHQSSSFLSSFNSRLVLFKMARSNSATFQLGMLHTHKHKRKSCDAAGSTLSLKLGTKSDPVDLISTPTAKTDVTRSLTDRSRSLFSLLICSDMIQKTFIYIRILDVCRPFWAWKASDGIYWWSTLGLHCSRGQTGWRHFDSRINAATNCYRIRREGGENLKEIDSWVIHLLFWPLENVGRRKKRGEKREDRE